MLGNIILFFGSIAIFLFGVKLMGEGLESVASGKLSDVIQQVTKNRLRAFLVGALFTLILQFSAATVVLTVGMVNSGIISLMQAGGIILGANLATPLKSYFITALPKFLMPLSFLAGTYLYVFSKEKKKRDVAYFFLGFGLIMVGLAYLYDSVEILNQEGQLQHLMMGVSDVPILGILIGLVFTILIQSSSGLLVILMAMASQGTLGMSMALPFVMGANIGTTSTALISSLGGPRQGKRAALIHLLVNALTAGILLPFMGPLQTFIQGLAPQNPALQIAHLHLAFNILLVLFMMPLLRPVVALTDRFLPGKDRSVSLTSSPLLDRRMMTSPSFAEHHLVDQTLRMGDRARDNVRLAVDAFIHDDLSVDQQVQDNENLIDYLEVQISSFLVKLSSNSLSEEDQDRIMANHHVINDLEKIGNLAFQIYKLAEEARTKHTDLSEEAREEVRSLYNYVIEAINVAVDSYRYHDKNLAGTMFTLTKHIRQMESDYRTNHITRLNRGKCSALSGILFLDVNSHLDRIGTHCQSIAETVLKY